MKNLLVFSCILSLAGCASDVDGMDQLLNQNKGISPLHKDAETLEDVFFEPDPDHSFWCSYYNQDC